MQKQLKSYSNIRTVLLLLLTSTLLVACAEGGSDAVTNTVNQESDLLQQPQADQPAQTQANTGLQVTLTSDSQNDWVSADYIEQQWVHMQNCLGITAVAPEVIVMSGNFSAESGEDDAIRYIDGRLLASAHVSDSGVTMQVTENDLDGSLGAKGSFMRSIMGRFLWFSSNLPERDYEYECANSVQS